MSTVNVKGHSNHLNGGGGDSYSSLCDMNKLAKRNNAKPLIVTRTKVSYIKPWLY